MSKIQISAATLPAPERKPLEVDELVYIFDPTDEAGYYPIQWIGGQFDMEWLKAGLVYRSEEDIKKVVQWFRATFQQREDEEMIEPEITEEQTKKFDQPTKIIRKWTCPNCCCMNFGWQQNCEHCGWRKEWKDG